MFLGFNLERFLCLFSFRFLRFVNQKSNDPSTMLTNEESERSINNEQECSNSSLLLAELEGNFYEI